MEEKEQKKGGVHVRNGQDVLAAMKAAVPHWIHDTVKDEHYPDGIKYLQSCTCSNCGFHVNMEKESCPHCGARMSKMKGIY